MSKNNQNVSPSLRDLAEGEIVFDELARDGASILRTATAPAVSLAKAPHGATGILHLPEVRMQTEGEEDKPASQDAKRNIEETQPRKPATSPTAKLQETPMNRAEKPLILIVEDTAELAEVIQATLENMGMHVEWVSHGSKGLDKLKANPPDVLLLDIGLPDMTGWKVLEELREYMKQHTDSKFPRVVVITAYGDPANRLIGKLQGIDSYLIKPFTSDEVEKVVQKALNAK